VIGLCLQLLDGQEFPSSSSRRHRAPNASWLSASVQSCIVPTTAWPRKSALDGNRGRYRHRVSGATRLNEAIAPSVTTDGRCNVVVRRTFESLSLSGEFITITRIFLPNWRHQPDLGPLWSVTGERPATSSRQLDLARCSPTLCRSRTWPALTPRDTGR